jgi:hypothetical protein
VNRPYPALGVLHEACFGMKACNSIPVSVLQNRTMFARLAFNILKAAMVLLEVASAALLIIFI